MSAGDIWCRQNQRAGCLRIAILKGSGNHASPRTADNGSGADVQCPHQGHERVGIVLPPRRSTPKYSAMPVPRGVPRHEPKAVLETGQLGTIPRGTRTDTVEKNNRWRVDRTPCAVRHGMRRASKSQGLDVDRSYWR